MAAATRSGAARAATISIQAAATTRWPAASRPTTSYGGAGDDLFIQGNGENVDNTYGGAGFDTYDASASDQRQQRHPDRHGGRHDHGPGRHPPRFEGIENVIGTGLGDSICGDNNDNTILGGAGDDTLWRRGRRRSAVRRG